MAQGLKKRAGAKPAAKREKQSKRAGGAASAGGSQTGITIEGIPFELPRVEAAEKKRAAALLEALEREYPDAHCELNFRSPHELLIATILSAQCTDVAVNK